MTKKKLPPKEVEIQKDILVKLKELKEYIPQFDYFRMNLGGVLHSFGTNVIRKKNPNEGMADILVIFEGRAIWLEIKRPKLGRQSDAQKAFEKRSVENGSVYKIVTSVEDLEIFLNTIFLELDGEEENNFKKTPKTGRNH